MDITLVQIVNRRDLYDLWRLMEVFLKEQNRHFHCHTQSTVSRQRALTEESRATYDSCTVVSVLYNWSCNTVADEFLSKTRYLYMEANEIPWQFLIRKALVKRPNISTNIH